MSTAGIYSEIYASLASNQSIFPSLPEITIRLRATLNAPSCDIASAAKLLKTDPGLSAFILRVANSVRYMSRVPPKDIESALRRIGLETTSRLATTFALRSSFNASNPVLRNLLIKSYRSATKVSVISYYLAQRFSGFDASKALLAGLLQDIAIPPIMLRLSERPEMLKNQIERTMVVDKLAPLVGVLILKNWGFSDDLIEVVRSRKQWQRDPEEKADLSDIVLIARLHSQMGTPEIKACPPFDEVPAFHKLPLGELTPSQSIKMLEDAKDELADLARLLSGG